VALSRSRGGLHLSLTVPNAVRSETPDVLTIVAEDKSIMNRIRSTITRVLSAGGVMLGTLALSSCLLLGDAALPDDQLAKDTASLDRMQNTFRGIARDVVPVVVSITVHDIGGGGNPWDFFFQDPDQADKPPREKDYERSGMGSGIIVQKGDHRYYVLTNYHVVKGGKNMVVLLSDEREYACELTGFDERKDLALVSIKTDEPLPVARLGDSGSLKVGDWVIAVGNPYGWKSSVTSGIVSALGRRLERNTNLSNVSDFIQTDANINPGNSGGALVNLRGEIVGINTWITSPTGGSIGIGFAIPVNNAKKLIRDLINDGKPQYGWLGVSIIRMITSDVEKQLGIFNRKGAFINYVIKNSPAQQGGLLPGDFITSVNGKPIVDESHLIQVIGELDTGVDVSFTLIRQGKEQNIIFRLAPRPAESAISSMSRGSWPGFVSLPLSQNVRDKYNIAPEETGVVVFYVEQGTPAFLAGLHSGDIVKRINGHDITDMIGFYGALNDQSAASLDFVIVRGGGTENLVMER
jgi:Do/DeqQ family serine protease